MARNDGEGRLRIDRGTVLAIPIDVGLWAIGQVLHPGVAFYLVIAEGALPEPLVASAIEGKRCNLFTWTNDAEVYNDSWKNLGVAPINYPPLLLPEYKIGAPGNMRVCDYEGRELRVYDEVRDASLDYMTVRSPKLVERVIKAANGIGDPAPGLASMRQR